MPQLAAQFTRGPINLHYWFAPCYFCWNNFFALWLVGNTQSVDICQISRCDLPLGLEITLDNRDDPAEPCHSSQLLTAKHNLHGKRSFKNIPSPPRWATQTTGLWTMISPLLLRPGSPGARPCCSPWRGTPSRERPCVSSASSCCCCSFSLFAASGSC